MAIVQRQRETEKGGERVFRSVFYRLRLLGKIFARDDKGWPNHNIIIGSDFDHGDAVATWPNTVQVIKTMPGLSEPDKEKVLGGNAMRLFGLNGNDASWSSHK